MEPDQLYNYEDSMIDLDGVLNQIIDAIRDHKAFSLGRYGHGEVAYLGWPEFPEWKKGYDPHASYAGATASVTTIKDDLLEALRTTDIVGFHVSWGDAWEDRGAADLTKKLLQIYKYKPAQVCSAFITHEMIKSDRFWECLKNQRIALVGRRAEEASPAFRDKGVDIVYTTGFEVYEDMEKVYDELSKREDWDVALLSTGIPATILAPQLANQTNKVVIDFGHALDKLIDGENFDYLKILKDWKEQVEKRILVSVVMTVYNGETYLKEAIDSVLSQTYENFEVIIVNDGSIDSTKMILDNIDDKRVKVIHLEQNQGAANALNTGIRDAAGEWIAIHDADDNSYPTRIEEQVKYVLEHPSLIGVGTLVECIPGSSYVSEDLLFKVAERRNSFITREQIREKIFWGSPFTHSSVMFSKDIFWEAGGYDTDFKIAYDYDLWLRLLEKGEIENVPKVLLQYRIHNKSLSNIDSIATVNEIQIASSRAIYRLCNSSKKSLPRVVVIGPPKGCKNYRDNIAPASGLSVDALVSENSTRLIPYGIMRLKDGKADAIVVLDGTKQDSILQYFKRRKLELNVQVFNLCNILE